MRGHREKVRIVGGGLTGVLAALEAHRLGCRDIVLHERFDMLGGALTPRQDHGLEIRNDCVYFGPRGEAVRGLLEEHGVGFEDFENRLGSVSPTPCGDIAITHDFGGPALAARDLTLTPPVGESLTDRIRAYPTEIGEVLARYCQWHLGSWLDEAHADAAVQMAANRVFPLGPDIAQIAARKRSDPLHDQLYGLPRSLWGRLDDMTASLPAGGFANLFAQCRRALATLGVEVRTNDLVSPGEAAACEDLLVWTADLAALFPACGLDAPKPIARAFATYVFRARYAGPLPFHVQNFTASGSVFRVYLYESRGQVLALAECVRECGDAELRREIHRLMSGFAGATLSLREQIGADVASRFYPSVDLRRRLPAMARTLGPGFILAGGFGRMRAALAEALEVEDAVSAA